MSKPILVCLHGWGGSKESFTELRHALEQANIEILTPDLPGFGKEAEPSHPFTVEDYALWVTQYLQRTLNGDWNTQEWYLLGHSHGGRIAIKLITHVLEKEQFPAPKHIFLCASAGIRRKRHVKRVIGLVLAKCGKTLLSLPILNMFADRGKVLLYKLVRVHDYENASEIMRKTLINVSQEDLRPVLKNINIPTEIFWGTEDNMTPYADAIIMKNEITHSTLHTFKGVRHGVHREKATEIAQCILSVLHHS